MRLPLRDTRQAGLFPNPDGRPCSSTAQPRCQVHHVILKGLEDMSLSRPCVRLLGLVLLVGLTACGSPAPDAPLSGQAGAVVSPPAGDGAGVGSAAHAPASQDHTPAARLGAPTNPVVQPEPFRSEAARIIPAVTPTSPKPAALPTVPSDEQTSADQAQQQARARWYAEMREAPEAGTRLYALDLWAQQPTAAIDPVTYALVDEEESVRTRAQELYEQHLVREAAPPPKNPDVPASARPTVVGQKGL
jgi:hypothetical protein